MNLNRLIWFGLLLAICWFVLMPFLGIATSLIAVILFSLALAITLDYTRIWKIFPFPLSKKFGLLLMIGLWAVGIFYFGWFSGLLSGLMPTTAVISPITAPTTTGVAGCVVSEELKGKSASISVNAWDLESNTPYASAVDFTTNCVDYKNGNQPANFVGNSSDTSAGSISGYTVGDTLYIYCGGSTYYGEPVEGFCIDSEAPTLNINAHTIVSSSNMAITGYDDTGGTALSAGTAAEEDYYVTIGADEELAIYLKLKVNVANKAYQFCGWGTTTFYNVTSVKPQNVEATYTKIATPEHMQSVDVNVNATASSGNLTVDYSVYKADTPILLQEWDSLKEQFVIESDTTYDPIAHDNGDLQETKFNGVSIVSKDCTYARGGDGRIYLDLYAHTETEADVGLDEDEAHTRGKTTGVLIETR